MAQGFIKVSLDNLVNHAELVTELAVGSGPIQDPEGVLPETAAHRQDGIVLGEMRNVVLSVTDACTCQMPGRPRPGWFA